MNEDQEELPSVELLLLHRELAANSLTTALLLRLIKLEIISADQARKTIIDAITYVDDLEATRPVSDPVARQVLERARDELRGWFKNPILHRDDGDKAAEQEKVELFMEGDSGFALLGLDLQVGESEYIVVDDAFRAKWPDLQQPDIERAACITAYHNLRRRLGRDDLDPVWRSPAERE